MGRGAMLGQPATSFQRTGEVVWAKKITAEQTRCPKAMSPLRFNTRGRVVPLAFRVQYPTAWNVAQLEALHWSAEQVDVPGVLGVAWEFEGHGVRRSVTIGGH